MNLPFCFFSVDWMLILTAIIALSTSIGVLIYAYQAYWLRSSVISYRSAERAFIMFQGINIVEPSSKEPKRSIHWSFQNYGRGPGIVIEVAHTTELIPATGKIPNPSTRKDHARAGAYQGVAGGGIMATSDRSPGQVGTIPPCHSDDIQDGPGWESVKAKEKRLLFCGSVTYQSMSNGSYYRRYFTAVWNPDHNGPGNGQFHIHNKPGYNDEVGISAKEATRGGSNGGGE